MFPPMFAPMPIGVVVGLVPGVLACLVTEIYCHRAVAHRAFRVHPTLAWVLDQFMLVYGGVHPRRWAAIHRLHHRYADTPLDPHSPIERHPLLVLVGTPYLFAAATPRLPADSPGPGRAHVAARVAITAFWLVTVGLAQTLLALAVYFVVYFGIIGMVNTVGHRSGRKPHPDAPGYDSAWLAPLLLGHGYHNSHHAHPAAARVGRLDPMWPIVRLLAGVGLIAFHEPRARSRLDACCLASAASATAPGR
jgi:stearoyl-CoA desaturase (delta-9 desaturase)